VALPPGVPVNCFCPTTTRNGKDWTGRFPSILEAASGLKARSCLIDGEAVACDGRGLAVFERIRYRRADESVFSYAFDLLELDGQDLRREPIETRKGRWRACCAAVGSGLRLVRAPLARHYRHACKLGCEGIVSKRLGSPYVSGRTRHWLKFKNPAAPAVKREAEEEWG
jgi:bifunctional non-homologous end joining protein LigD